MRRLALAAAAALALAASVARAAGEARLQPMEISARQITQFRIGSDETRFGPLEFVGGLELTGSTDFGALSAFRFLTPGSSFAGVADTGFWFFGSIARDASGRPSGLRDFAMQAMVDAKGRPNNRKWEVDAEGLAVKDGVATVGFEREHRIAQFRLEPAGMGVAFGNVPFLVPKNELRTNRGFETVVYAPSDGPHRGGLIVVSEKSLDRRGNIFAAVLQGPRKGVFSVRRNGEFDITDGAMLPDGDLLLLERSFSMATGVRMRLRRIGGETIGTGALVDGQILIDADMSDQIDNMEAMDVWRRADGELMVSLMSDDNHSILQRNLYLEFVLHED